MAINTLEYIEKYVKIIDKSNNIIDLNLNEPQLRLYNLIKQQAEAEKPIRIIILKARQMGFSTLTEAILFKTTVTRKNIRSGIITHSEDATNNLFQMSKLMYERLPQAIKPSIKNSNARELVFDNERGTGLKSKIKCMTAGSNGVGRSGTFTNLHISEYAFWQGDKKSTLNGLMQAVPNTPDSIVIIESTANGFEHYKEMWDRAVSGESDFVPLFVGWNELEQYQMKYTGFELTQEEEELKQQHNLSNEQITWRRWCIKNNCSGDIEQFKQEYPINPYEAFISTGECVFDKVNIIARIDQDSDYLIGNMENNTFIEDKNGKIKVYKQPEKDVPYVIGGDTSGEGSDYFTAQVINNITGEQVAVYRNRTDADLYVDQIMQLGYYYNEALISIEANFDSYPIRKLDEKGYKKQYIREQTDTYTGRLKKTYGFKTTSQTRPVIIDELKVMFREQPELFNDKDTLMEMLTFIKNEKGRAEAQNGSHDDLVMALAIAYYCRTQQDMTIRKPIDTEHTEKYKEKVRGYIKW